MIIDSISDLHGSFPEMQGGDLLIVGGDMTSNDSFPAWKQFFDWIEPLKYRKKVVIAGNHDNYCVHWSTARTFTNEELEEMEVKESFDYLCDSMIEFEGLKIWGSPWTRRFHGQNPKCAAFTLVTDHELHEKFNLIPENIDILVTHSPVYGVLDFSNRGGSLGSTALREHVMHRVKPKIHVCGHIHEGGGKTLVIDDITYINAAHMNECYDPTNKATRIII